MGQDRKTRTRPDMGVVGVGGAKSGNKEEGQERRPFDGLATLVQMCRTALNHRVCVCV